MRTAEGTSACSVFVDNFPLIISSTLFSLFTYSAPYEFEDMHAPQSPHRIGRRWDTNQTIKRPKVPDWR